MSLFRNLNLELTGNHPPWTKSGLYVFGFLAFINLYLIEFWSIIQQSLKLYRFFFSKTREICVKYCEQELTQDPMQYWI